MNKFKRHVGLAVLLFFCLSMLAAPGAMAFPDVKNNHWAQKYIDYLVIRGIVSGYGDGTYRPEKGVTRGEFAAMLIKALNMEDSAWALKGAGQLFRDVPPDYWGKNNIQLAWELGIVSGYADGTFRPNQTIRRDEMVSMLVRALRSIGQGRNKVDFRDAAQIPPWVKSSVDMAARWGLVSGFEDRTFRPAANVTRAQAAVFIRNLLDQRGTSFDLTGEVRGVYLAGKELQLEVNGGLESFKYTDSLKIYKGNAALDLGSLTSELPAQGMVVLNSQGQVAYLELDEPGAGDTILTLAPKLEQIPTSKPLAGGQAGLLERTLDSMNTEPAIKSSQERAARSLETTKEIMGVNRLAGNMKVDGSGITIAVVDSGLDPLHADLLKTPRGEEKLVDFIDLTDEGLVDTNNALPAKNSANLEGVSYILGNIPSKSGVYYYGFFYEEQIDFDVDFNGSKTDRFLVLVTDPQVSGVYDSVYIDTNNNASLFDEKPLAVYSKNKDKAKFSSSLQGNYFNFVVSEIDSSGSKVKLGFDANGHGTQVTGVASANGNLTGIAPGAKILAIKVLDKKGETSWELLEKGIRTAVNSGAKVVNLSLGYYQDETFGNNSLTYLIESLSKKNNVVFVAAAGNKGPGIGTLATPGNAKSAIGVGAYVSPTMWKNDYGWDVSQESLWYFSSMGPRQDGLVAPTVVAPGSAITTYPAWSDSAYRLAEGTSIASPHVAGAVALMLECISKEKIQISAEQIKRAIELGADPLPQFNIAEVGYGVIDAVEAWSNIRRLEDQPQTQLKSYTWNRKLGIGEGIYARDFLPGLVPYQVGNPGEHDQVVFWETTAEWLKPWFKMTSLPKGSQRDIPVDYVLPEKPGIYSAFLQGGFLNSYAPEVKMLTTVVKPYLLNKDNGFRFEANKRLGAAQFERYFFHVPEGTEGMQAILTVPKNSGGYQGRVRMHIIKPNGEEYMMSDYAGEPQEGMSGLEWVGTTIDNPDAGNWEVVVYSSPSLSSLGLGDSQYRLRVQLSGVPEEDVSKVTSQYLIGMMPKKLEPGTLNYISLSIRDKTRKTPIDDIMIEINGQIYQVKKGWVTFTIVPSEEQLKLDVRI